MGFMSKTTTYDPMSMYRPEQKTSVQALMDLAGTGTGGGITLGEQYGGDLGYYQQGEQGLAGGSELANLMNTAYDPNSDMGQARGIYSDFADLGKFNPDDPKWGYASFNKALAKAGDESASTIERERAITGDRFGTAIQGEKADLAENLNLQRQQRLSEMFQSSQQFAALGAQGFSGLANQVADIAGLNINYDDYQRQLKDTQAKDALTEFKRTRAEELGRIELMQDQMNNPLGVITKKGPSTFAKMWGTFNPIIGAYNQQKYGYTAGQMTPDKAIELGMKAFGMASTGGMSGLSGGATATAPSGFSGNYNVSSGVASGNPYDQSNW